MKIGFHRGLNQSFQSRLSVQGHTYTGLMVASALLLLVAGGVLAAHIFGLRMFGLIQARQGLGDSERLSLQSVQEDVRGARIVLVGSGSQTGFTPAGAESLQVGNALQLHPTGETNRFIRFYVDSKTMALMRVASDKPTPMLLVGSLKSEAIFQFEDFAGNVLNRRLSTRVVTMELELTKLSESGVEVGKGKHFSEYQHTFRVTHRAGD